MDEKVSIRPGVAVLSVLRHLNYKPWFAMAEFIDNSVQSFIANRPRIRAVEENCNLRISIEFDIAGQRSITIRDNAAGISADDFQRAFRPAELPPDSTGLSEFGMGMKSAACWFSPRWTVRTSALGENVTRMIRFDVAKIVNDSIEELSVEVIEGDDRTHFTEITLYDVYSPPVGRTKGKIKEHLTEIYRQFIRNGDLRIEFDDGQHLQFEEPPVLFAPQYNEKFKPVGEPVLWKKDLDFNFGEGLRAKGFAALREKGSTKYAGFSLFRRNRLIVGSADEKYRPTEIFGSPNDFVFQRLFGELHLEGFGVSHTKDGFQWDENEAPFLELLKEELNLPPLSLISQARQYRSTPSRADIETLVPQVAVDVFENIKISGGDLVRKLFESKESQEVFVCEIAEVPASFDLDSGAEKRIVDFDWHFRKWRLVLELVHDPSISPWFELSKAVIRGVPDEGRFRLGVRVNLAHELLLRFATGNEDAMAALTRVAIAFAIAEQVAIDSGIVNASAVRRFSQEALSILLGVDESKG